MPIATPPRITCANVCRTWSASPDRGHGDVAAVVALDAGAGHVTMSAILTSRSTSSSSIRAPSVEA